MIATNMCSNFSGKCCSHPNYMTNTTTGNIVMTAFSLLTILAAPDVTTTNSLRELLDIHSTLTLTCSFEGVPLPLLEWLHNGLPLNNSNVSITDTNFLFVGTSTLQWVNASPDTVGTFTCAGTNILGSSSRSINVQIRSKFVSLFNVWFCCIVTFIVV